MYYFLSNFLNRLWELMWMNRGLANSNGRMQVGDGGGESMGKVMML
jgi:hypothetical protein